ncbi:GNAT family N-acetyltransferase [Xylophilus sp. GW821-FHT01B05]
MPFRFQLEPPSLIEHFQQHPPQGFALLPGAGAPAFAAPFDLLTTADDELKRRAATLPLHRHWSRLLRIRTAFVGTTVSEYALVPPGLPAAALPASVRAKLAPGHRLSIIKDIPQQSPLLPAEDNAFADALADACQQQGFILVEGQALAYVPIDFADIDAYLARLSTSRRKNLKRKLRSRAELQVRRIPTGAAFANDAVVDAFFALYEGVYAQSEVHFDRLTRDFFAAVLRDEASGGTVFEYRRAADGALLGWNLCFEHGGKLIDKYIGFAYPAAREANLYFVSWMVNLEYAIERGLSHYVAGWTDPEVKAQLGAQFSFTRHAVYIRNPLLRAIGRRFAGRFESDRQWSEKE